MRKLKLSCFLFFFIFMKSMAQFFPDYQRAIDSLKSTTNYENWRIKDFDELSSRSKAPFIKKSQRYKKDNVWGHTFRTFDMSNNNLSGELTLDFMVDLTRDRISLYRGGSGLYGTVLRFSHNKLEKITKYACHTQYPASEFRFDNNKLKTLELIIPWNNIGAGCKVITLHQNDLSGVTSKDLTFKSYFTTTIIDNKADLFRIDNNRLDFTSLCDIITNVTKATGYNSFRQPGNPDIIIDYSPQKPLGGDYTEEIIEKDAEKTLSFNLRHADNIYSWQLNGKDVPLSKMKNYTFTADESSVGIYRCKVTNPNLKGVELFSYDMGVFLKKDENKSVSDIAIIQNTLCDSFPESSVVSTFEATDPDGDKVYYRLPDKIDDNSHFRIINGQTLISAEPLFDVWYIEKYTITVEAYDIYGGKFRKQFEILKSPEQPTEPLPKDIILNDNIIEENSLDNIVGNIELVDATGYTFSLDNSNDNENFEIEGNILKAKNKLDFEAKNRYNVRVKAEKGGFYIQKDFTIEVTNANDAPNDLYLTNSRFKVNTLKGTIIGQLIASDQDPEDREFVYELPEDNPENKNFILHGNILKLAKYITEPASYDISVKVSDKKGASSQFNIRVNCMAEDISGDNNLPEGIWLTNNTLRDDVKINNVVSTVQSFDKDGDNLSFTIENEYFFIENKTLKVKKIPQKGENIDITIRCSDGKGEINKSFIIYNMSKPPYTPVSLCGLSSYIIRGDHVVGDVIGEIATDILDGTDVSFYTENEYVKIEGNKLILKSVPPAGSDFSVNISKNCNNISTNHQFKIVNKILIPNDANTPPLGVGITNNYFTSEQNVGSELARIYMCDKESVEGVYSCTNDYIEIQNDKILLKEKPDETISFNVVIKCSDGEHIIEQDFVFYYSDNKQLGNIETPSIQNLLYPNPAVNNLKLRYNNNQISNIDISVVDQLGRVVYSKKYESQNVGEMEYDIPVYEIPQGIYFIKIDDGIKSKSYKFFKK